MFNTNSYSIIGRVDKLIYMDIYLLDYSLFINLGMFFVSPSRINLLGIAELRLLEGCEIFLSL